MRSILVVDDAKSMRQMVAFTLKKAGFTVLEAQDGVEALATAKAQPFDLVLSDVKMPNMDGLDLVRALRGLSSYQFVPILLLTTDSSPAKKAEGKAAGATGWLVKPFRPEELVATVNKALG